MVVHIIYNSDHLYQSIKKHHKYVTHEKSTRQEPLNIMIEEHLQAQSELPNLFGHWLSCYVTLEASPRSELRCCLKSNRTDFADSIFASECQCPLWAGMRFPLSDESCWHHPYCSSFLLCSNRSSRPCCCSDCGLIEKKYWTRAPFWPQVGSRVNTRWWRQA